MIKVELEYVNGVARLRLESSDPTTERDTMDTIGNLILCTNPKRGSYEGDVMVVDVKNG